VPVGSTEPEEIEGSDAMSPVVIVVVVSAAFLFLGLPMVVLGYYKLRSSREDEPELPSAVNESEAPPQPVLDRRSLSGFLASIRPPSPKALRSFSGLFGSSCPEDPPVSPVQCLRHVDVSAGVDRWMQNSDPQPLAARFSTEIDLDIEPEQPRITSQASFHSTEQPGIAQVVNFDAIEGPSLELVGVQASGKRTYLL